MSKLLKIQIKKLYNEIVEKNLIKFEKQLEKTKKTDKNLIKIYKKLELYFSLYYETLFLVSKKKKSLIKEYLTILKEDRKLKTVIKTAIERPFLTIFKYKKLSNKLTKKSSTRSSSQTRKSKNRPSKKIGGDNNEEDLCLICMENVDNNQETMHFHNHPINYHIDCLTKWRKTSYLAKMQANRNHNLYIDTLTCPYCNVVVDLLEQQKQILHIEEDDEEDDEDDNEEDDNEEDHDEDEIQIQRQVQIQRQHLREQIHIERFNNMIEIINQTIKTILFIIYIIYIITHSNFMQIVIIDENILQDQDNRNIQADIIVINNQIVDIFENVLNR